MGKQPLYRRTEADDGWWLEGNYAQFRYGTAWRSWLQHGGCVAAILLGLGLTLGLSGGDLELGLSFAVFMLGVIGVVYLPFFLLLQLPRSSLTYIKIGPRGIEWRDDIGGERRADAYYFSASLGIRPRRLEWASILGFRVPPLPSTVDSIGIIFFEAPDTGYQSERVGLSSDGLYSQQALCDAIIRYGDLVDVAATPPDDPSVAELIGALRGYGSEDDFPELERTGQEACILILRTDRFRALREDWQKQYGFDVWAREPDDWDDW